MVLSNFDFPMQPLLTVSAVGILSCVHDSLKSSDSPTDQVLNKFVLLPGETWFEKNRMTEEDDWFSGVKRPYSTWKMASFQSAAHQDQWDGSVCIKRMFQYLLEGI